jgi:hypothetical protein
VITDPFTSATLPSEGCFSHADASKAIDTRAKAATSAQSYLPRFVFIQIYSDVEKKNIPPWLLTGQ